MTNTNRTTRSTGRMILAIDALLHIEWQEAARRVSKRCNVTYQQARGWIKSDNCTIEVLTRLSAGLGVTPNVLLDQFLLALPANPPAGWGQGKRIGIVRGH